MAAQTPKPQPAIRQNLSDQQNLYPLQHLCCVPSRTPCFQSKPLVETHPGDHSLMPLMQCDLQRRQTATDMATREEKGCGRSAHVGRGVDKLQAGTQPSLTHQARGEQGITLHRHHSCPQLHQTRMCSVTHANTVVHHALQARMALARCLLGLHQPCVVQDLGAAAACHPTHDHHCCESRGCL